MAGLEDFYPRRMPPPGAQDLSPGQGARAGGLPPFPRQQHPPPPPHQPSWSAQAPPQYVDTPRPHLQFPRENPPGFVPPGVPRAAAQVSSSGVSGSPTSDRYAGLSFGVTGLVTEFFVSHPFVVLRRQCQVNNASLRRHRTPLTLLPAVAGLHRTQGLGCLWKGLGSTLTVRGLTLAAEDLASKLTPWPKEVDRRSSLRMVGQHLLLKAVSLAAVSPFYSASLVETVQSEVASERPGVLDVFREGLHRAFSWDSSGRMLPVWILVPPTVAHGVAHYAVYVVASSLSHTAIVRTSRKRQQAKGAVVKVPKLMFFLCSIFSNT